MSDPASTGQDAPVVDNEAAKAAATPEKEVAAPNATTDAQAEEPESQAQEKTFTQAELDEILAKRIAKAEAKAERRVLRALERIAPPVQQQEQQPVNNRPTRDQFASQEVYEDALVDWKLDQRDAKANQSKAVEQSRSLNDRTEKLYSEAAKMPGFDRESFEELPLTPVIAQALIESDAPAKLMAYMTSNPEDVERISALSPARQAAEIGKLEAKLASAPSVKTTKTPAPINPVGGGNASTGVTAQSAKTMDEFLAVMRKNGSRWVK